MDDTPKPTYLDRDRGWQLPPVRPVPPAEDTIAELEASIQNCARHLLALRAILAPLLDDPIYCNDADQLVCPFCNTHTVDRDEDRFTHRPDCPVLHADVLLGRVPVA